MRTIVPAILSLLALHAPLAAAPLVGFTELATNLPGGRHANVRTFRAAVVEADGTGRRLIGESLADNPDAWTQFAGWSPDGKQAIVSRGWQDPENAAWEEKHKSFRFATGKWRVDACLVDIATGAVTNLSAVERVSEYNSGLFYLPGGKGFGFTALIGGVSKPYVMDLDGRNKRDVSGNGGGFAYGYSASPDGERLVYHENYQIAISGADGSGKKLLNTGHPFNFMPRWSPDGARLLFLSGEHYNCHPYVARADGEGLTKLADRGGYRGVIEFLDVADFHGGSSDTPIWAADGKSVFYTANVEGRVELMQVSLAGEKLQLTQSAAGVLHYHPTLSSDGQTLLYGAKRDSVRQIYSMNLADRSERRLTDPKPGRAAMWPHPQPR